jgi:hypothetical protein
VSSDAKPAGFNAEWLLLALPAVFLTVVSRRWETI